MNDRMFDLTGRKALITGSSQGIGKAIAECFAAYGATVFIHASADPAKSLGVAAAIRARGQQAHSGVANLADADAPERLYSQVVAAMGEPDILVLNASVQIRSSWQEITLEQINRQLQVNLVASTRLIQLFEPGMAARGWGRIVTVGSIQQYKPHKDMLIYAASKAAQMNLVSNLAKQISASGVTINNLSPGVIQTPRNEQALSDAEYHQKILEGIPAGYAGLAEDLTGSALLLCSDAGRYITGIDLLVDGGMHL